MDLHGFSADADSRPRKEKPKIVADVYDLQHELGHGQFGCVYKAVRKDTGLAFAVKHIDKKKAGTKGLTEVMSEVETLGLLDHPYIVRLEETFEDPNNLWIVMEFVAGGELAHKLKEVGKFPESTVKKMCMCMLLAVEYLHRKGIVHRDLKPANCLLSDEGDVEIKIADFGFSVMVGPDACLKSFCGTTTFMAPEILLEKNYGKPVDMWAVGVIAYLLLSGTYPFPGSTNTEVMERITSMKFEFPEGPGQPWEGVSLGARDFVSKILVNDPTKRLSAHDALRHVWVQTGMSEDDWDYYGIDKSGLGAAVRGGGRRKHPRLLWKGASQAIRATHRFVYLVKCRRYKKEGIDFPFTHNFGYMVTGVYYPRFSVVNVSGLASGNVKVLNVVLDMVEASTVVDTLDVSHNGIDSLDFVQNVVRVATTHPSLTSINLEGNPIPPLAGRALQRLARSTVRLRVINVRNTPIGAELQQQIAQCLKDSEKKRSGGGGSGSAVGKPLLPDDHEASSTRLPILLTHRTGGATPTLGRTETSLTGGLPKSASAPRIPPTSPPTLPIQSGGYRQSSSSQKAYK